MGLGALATKFGVKGNPANKYSYHLDLGKKMFGENPVFDYKENPELSDAELREAARNEIKTPIEWAGMNVKVKRKFKVAGLGLVAMAGRFGIKGNPVNNHKYHLELGKKIYGDNPCFDGK
jgi:hypothetical protein